MSLEDKLAAYKRNIITYKQQIEAVVRGNIGARLTTQEQRKAATAMNDKHRKFAEYYEIPPYTNADLETAKLLLTNTQWQGAYETYDMQGRRTEHGHTLSGGATDSLARVVQKSKELHARIDTPIVSHAAFQQIGVLTPGMRAALKHILQAYSHDFTDHSKPQVQYMRDKGNFELAASHITIFPDRIDLEGLIADLSRGRGVGMGTLSTTPAPRTSWIEG